MFISREYLQKIFSAVRMYVLVVCIYRLMLLYFFFRFITTIKKVSAKSEYLNETSQSSIVTIL